jgi:predicted esterase
MQRFHILFVTLFTIMCACSSRILSVHVIKIVIPTGDGHNIEADLFEPVGGGTEIVLIVGYGNDSERPQWTSFAGKIAERKYPVLLMPVDDDSAWSGFVAAIHYLRQTASFVDAAIVCIGAEATGNAAIEAAVRDSSIAAVVALTPLPSHRQNQLIDQVRQLRGRPLLLIASEGDTVAPAAEIERIYDAAESPKKLVWLVGTVRGAPLLSTDMEPIIRRVCLLFMEKFGGKNE